MHNSTQHNNDKSPRYVITVDIGNTNVKIGLFDDKQLVRSFKMSSDVKRTSDEYMALLLQMLQHNNIAVDSVKGAIMSSVIPQLDYTFVHVLEYCFGVKPLIVGVGVKTGLAIKYDFPRELGSDRIITAVATVKKYGAPFVLVDFGTATTYNVVNDKKEFLGGAITLGIRSSSAGLANYTSKLPDVELRIPDKVVAQSTAKAIQSGVLYGAVGQVKYMIQRIKEETGLSNAKIIATGGLSQLVADVEPIFDHIDRELSLWGLYYIYKMNTLEE